MSGGPTREGLLAVLTFARRFDAPDFVAGEWVAPGPGPDGVLQADYWVASQAVGAWEQALYMHSVVLPFDWTEPEWIREMRRNYADPSLLATTDLLRIRKVLTTLVRVERFREGSLAAAFERGVPQAAMMRLAEIAMDE